MDSDKINSLSPEAEVMFYRLLVVADDLGLMDARHALLRARCFPLKESLSSEKVGKWLDEIWTAGLIGRYEVDGKPFIQILEWEQRVRSHGKHPRPDDSQLSVNCPSIDGLGKGKGKGKGASNEVSFSAENGVWDIPSVFREQWGKAFPAVPLESELSAASAWLLANPANQKSNYARFLTGWMKRAQDRAPRKAANADPYSLRTAI